MVLSVLGASAPVRAQDPAEEKTPVVSDVLLADYRDQATHRLSTAQRDMKKSLGGLDRFLARNPRRRLDWRKYLEWEAVEAAMADESPRLQPLRSALAKYRSNETGLELAPFRRTAASLERLLQAATAARTKDPQAELTRRLDQLTAAVATLESAEVADDAIALRESVAWLEARGLAPEMLAGVRERFSHPNLDVRISSRLIAAATHRPVDATAPIRDRILGTRISGTGRTVGHVEVSPLPSRDVALLTARLNATNYSRTVGANGPARIFSRGRTFLEGNKQLVVDANGIRARPATGDAESRTKVTGIGSTAGCIGDRIVKRIAKRRIPKQQAQGERIAARHARRRVSRQFDEEMEPLVAKANLRFRDRFRLPLVRRDMYPAEQFKFSSTANELRLTALHDGRGRIGALSTPPPLSGQPDLSLRLNESFVNNVAGGLLAGRTIRQQDLEEQALEMLGRLPESLKDDDEQGPWSITFAQQDPIALAIRDNEVSLTFRARRFTTGDQRYTGMDVTVRYQLEREGGRLKGIRQGEPEVLPPNYVKGEQIPLRLTSLRNLLKRRFGKIFPTEFQAEDLKFPGDMARLGSLALVQFEASQGWLTLSWQQERYRGKLVRSQHVVSSAQRNASAK